MIVMTTAEITQIRPIKKPTQNIVEKIFPEELILKGSEDTRADASPVVAPIEIFLEFYAIPLGWLPIQEIYNDEELIIIFFPFVFVFLLMLVFTKV